MGVTALAVGLFLSGVPESYVLLKPSPTLFPPEGISTDAGTIHPECCDVANKTIVARFISDEGEFIEIETLGVAPDRALHCGATFVDDEWFDNELSSYKLRVRVRRSDVATVLRRPIRTPWAHVAAGLPVEVVDGGLFFGFYETTREFTLPVDGSLAGITYTAQKWKPPAERKSERRELRLLSGLVASVGDGGSIALLPGDYWPESVARRSGADLLLPVSADCARLTARVPSAAVMLVDAGHHMQWMSTHLCAGFSNLRVRADAGAFWPDGRVAGVVLREDGLDRTSWSSDGGTVCADTTLQGVEGALPLCYRAADVFYARPEE